MTLVEQLCAALESELAAEQVRVWLWLKFVAGGETGVMELRAQFPSDSVLIELLRIKLISTVGTRVIAEDWGEGSSSAVTAPGIGRRKSRSIGSKTPKTHAPSATTITPRRDSSTTKLDPPSRRSAAGKTPSERKRKTPPARRGKLARLSGRDRTRAAFDNPKLVEAKEVIAEAISWVFRRFNQARKRQSLLPLSNSQLSRYRGKLREVAKYVVENDVEIDTFLDFAFERTRWQKTAFPAPGVLAGGWFKGQWEARGETRKSRHAGHSYTEADKDLRGQLTEAGFDLTEIDDDDLSFIEEQGELLHEHPEHYTRDDDWHDIIAWVAEHKATD